MAEISVIINAKKLESILEEHYGKIILSFGTKRQKAYDGLGNELVYEINFGDPIEKPGQTKFGKTDWCVDDVILEAVEEYDLIMTEAEAEEILADNEGNLSDAMLEAGWSVIGEAISVINMKRRGVWKVSNEKYEIDRAAGKLNFDTICYACENRFRHENAKWIKEGTGVASEIDVCPKCKSSNLGDIQENREEVKK